MDFDQTGWVHHTAIVNGLRTMAQDIRSLIGHLGESRASVVGHDRGARVATRFAKDHPEILERRVVMDNVPTRVIHQDMEQNADTPSGRTSSRTSPADLSRSASTCLTRSSLRR